MLWPFECGPENLQFEKFANILWLTLKKREEFKLKLLSPGYYKNRNCYPQLSCTHVQLNRQVVMRSCKHVWVYYVLYCTAEAKQLIWCRKLWAKLSVIDLDGVFVLVRLSDNQAVRGRYGGCVMEDTRPPLSLHQSKDATLTNFSLTLCGEIVEDHCENARHCVPASNSSGPSTAILPLGAWQIMYMSWNGR